MTLLHIENLHANVGDKPIIKGLNLSIGQGEVHVIMGPNGSGKSTLTNVLTGHPGYTVTQGEITFKGQAIRDLPVHERAQLGMFLGMQYPVEIPGVTNINFLKTVLNAQRKARGLAPVDAIDFLAQVKKLMQMLDMPESFLHRNLNEGFSGGEKKRNEILQMWVLKPDFIVLDEIDSGLDIDALQSVSKSVNAMRDPSRSFLLVTHYQRLLKYIEPDFIHVFSEGKIIRSGDKTLAEQLEAQGYAWIEQESLQAECMEG